MNKKLNLKLNDHCDGKGERKCGLTTVKGADYQVTHKVFIRSDRLWLKTRHHTRLVIVLCTQSCCRKKHTIYVLAYTDTKPDLKFSLTETEN